MNDHAFGRRDAPVGRDRHVNEGRLAIGEAIDFRGGLVAQLGSGPGREHRRPQVRVPGHRSGKGRVDPEVDASPTAEFDSGGDSARRHSGVERLPARYHPRLVTGQLTQTFRDYVTHIDEYDYRYRQSSLLRTAQAVRPRDPEGFLHLYDKYPSPG